MAATANNSNDREEREVAFVSRRGPVSKEELLRHTEHDPEGAAEFVALLHRLRRERAEASARSR